MMEEQRARATVCTAQGMPIFGTNFASALLTLGNPRRHASISLASANNLV